MYVIAIDPGFYTGYAIYRSEVLVNFGKFRVDKTTNLMLCLNTAIGDLRMALAITEEHSPYVYGKMSKADKRGGIQKRMTINARTRQQIEKTLLKQGIPHLSILPQDWDADRYSRLDVLAELNHGKHTVGAKFWNGNNVHTRDAIVMGARCIRRRIWK